MNGMIARVVRENWENELPEVRNRELEGLVPGSDACLKGARCKAIGSEWPGQTRSR